MEVFINNEQIENGNIYTQETFPQGIPKFYIENEHEHAIVIYDRNSKNPCYLHYLQINNKIIVDYVPPTPPKGTGKHEYVIVLINGENLNPNDFHFSSRSGFKLGRSFPHSDIIEKLKFYVSY